MTYKRERERKFVLTGMSYAKAKEVLNNLSPSAEEGTSKDTFWSLNGMDFIRLRANTREMTVKVTDNEELGVLDRIEENVVVSSLEDARRFLEVTCGESVMELTKTFSVHYIRDHVVSLYTVAGHDEVFFEVEAEELSIVEEACDDYYLLFNLDPVHQSLFAYFGG